MPSLVSPATLEQIRAASDIVDVIGSYLPLKRAGANFTALCPFHREKTPSFNVSPQRQIYHCFGCHKGGDVFRFVQDYENLSFIEAVRRLAERARIPLEFESTPAQQHKRFLKDTLLEIHEQVTRRWQAALQRNPAAQIARDYLARRGVAAEAIQSFRLGYAADAWDDVVQWARAQGYEAGLVEQAGLVIRKEADAGGEARFYDRFRGRLMFPIADEQGRVVAFSGRILQGDEKTAKYVNSPETPIFTKGRVFFGLDKSRRALLDQGFAIVCEGQLDLIAIHSAGLPNVVAPQGTALTADHCHILKRYVEEVVLCFDSDAAGQNATLRALDDLLGSGLAIRVATVPAPHDPDSFIRAEGGEAFRRLIQSAEGFFEYLLKRLCVVNDVASDRGRAAVVRGMAEAVHKTGNAVVIDTYAQRTAQRLGVSVEAVRAEFGKTPSASARQSPAESEPARAAPAAEPASPEEFWLLRLLLTDEELIGTAATHLDCNWIRHGAVRRLVERRLGAYAEGNWQGVAAMLGQLGDDEASHRLVTEAVGINREIPNRQQQLLDILKALRDAAIDRQIHELRQRLEDNSVPHGERLSALERHAALLRAKREPLRALPAGPVAPGVSGSAEASGAEDLSHPLSESGKAS